MVALLSCALALVEVVGASACPDRATIAEKLGPLLAGQATVDRVRVEPVDGELVVELHSPEGALLGSRRLPATGSCAERAGAVAVLIAAWEADLTELSAPPTPVALPPMSSPQAVVQVRAQPQKRLAWDLAASFLGSIAGGAFAPGGAVDVKLGRQGFPLAARIGLAGMGTRDVSLGSGTARWTRAAVLLGPAVDVVRHPFVRLDLHADFAAGWMFVEGQGYPSSHASNAFDPGLGGGARLAITRWKVAPFIDCSVLGWLRRQTVSASLAGEVATAELPRFDVWLRAGIAYGAR